MQLSRPTAQDMMVVRLGWIHLVPHASKAYLDEHGTPTTIAELARHRLLLQFADQAATLSYLRQVIGDVPFTGFVALTTSVGSAHALAVANGGGIGWLPSYASAL